MIIAAKSLIRNQILKFKIGVTPEKNRILAHAKNFPVNVRIALKCSCGKAIMKGFTMKKNSNLTSHAHFRQLDNLKQHELKHCGGKPPCTKETLK